MQVQGTIISLSLETEVKKNGGGSYKGWELVYKSSDGEVRTIAKPVQGLKFNASLKTQLESFLVGDKFTLEQEKNPAGFYDVKSIVQGWSGGEVSAPVSTSAQTQKVSGGTPYQSSSYPTKEERAQTQRYIIRQSSLTNAVATLSVGSKSLNPKDVLVLAEQYVDFIFEQLRGQEGIDALQDDIPE
ncbi:MAG: hypothetical protein DDT42_01599 [candidate division WS2 bacterium]|uniref:Uncharacterized protein n=1 Tax=Psychracetigena formicireducens TaxID=2986056 RepID=A0A9E2F7L6_PSYF1|nr:hypothetical protein [Candidatus Psychracetigena formicireducens]